MATLQKFKLLATQCAVMGSPTRSPTTSPVIHLRRRKTLRMLLSRGSSSGRRMHRREEGSPEREEDSTEQRKVSVSSQKLKDLFNVSSPPAPVFDERNSGNVREEFFPTTGFSCVGGFRREWAQSLRPLSATFRQRLLRKAWRPVLVTIPEVS